MLFIFLISKQRLEMENFIAYNPVKVHFGKDVCSGIGETAKLYGKKALLVIGQGSVKRNGIFDQICAPLTEAGIEIIEFAGIKPNPLVSDVDQAIALGSQEKADMVIAIGGGSVIDSSKIISVCIPEKLDGWKVMTGKQKPVATLPLISVLTLAATGTEMNMFAVLQNPESGRKIGFGTEQMYPKHSYLDPAFTTTVNKAYTAYGIVDLIAHALENYFGDGDAPLADSFVISIVKEAIEIAPMLLNNLDDYNLRARMLWASTCALNGTTVPGRKSGDWTVHGIGHTLSLLYDTPHGATLSIVYPAWLKHIAQFVPEKIEKLGIELFGTSDIGETIMKLSQFFKSVESPVKMQQAGIGIEKKEEILNHWLDKKPRGMIYKIEEDDYAQLLEWMYE